MTEYWHTHEGKRRPNEKVSAFMRDLFAVYEKHNMSLGHEDDYGAFLVEENCEANRGWLESAHVEIGGDKK